MIRNPILPGFNPDPSIVRVGDDYYIATSTFEWYPGVQIHQSSDLANWTLVTRPLNRKAQLDMRGNPDSCGVWAPCLSYADGLFWLVYTDVKRFDGSFKDAHNYIVTAPAIEGPWSDPVYVNSSGFDPSLFHDDDGRKWFLQMQWNHRKKAFNTLASGLRWHPLPGMGCRGRPAGRAGAQYLRRHRSRPGRGRAYLQAQWLVSYHRSRRRHGL
jgi:xylan 1,4-beta-xylosidase